MHRQSEGAGVSRRAPVGTFPILLLAVVPVAASLSLVTAQHRSRGLFVELGRLQAQAKELEAEGSRLRIELGKAAQPTAVAAAARQLGMRPTESRQAVFLAVPTDADIAAAVAAEGRP
jgi:cell division protein FtsL